MAVKSGTPLVSTGDSVKKGTTLISGLIYYYSDDFTVTQTDKIKADGEIIMRTKEVYENSIPVEYYEKTITDTKKSIKNVYFGQYQFDLPVKKRQNHRNKEKIIKNRSFFLSSYWNHISDDGKISTQEENLNQKRSTVQIKKTVRTLSCEKNKRRGKDRSL